MIHQYKLNGYNIVLDVYSGSVHSVDDLAYDVIAMYEKCGREEIIAALLDKYSDDSTIDAQEISDCIDDVEELKAQGKRLFLLSNLSKGFAARSGKFPILRHFEKKVFSAVCGFVKPSKEIFEYLCAECGISPQETVFIDDSPKNILGAESCGIRGYLFDGNVEKLRKYLSENL